MKRPEITPGEWRENYPGAFGDPALIYAAPDDVCIASVHRTTDAQAIAAIPDMMDALEVAFKMATALHSLLESFGENLTGYHGEKEKIQSAMEKAGYIFD